MGIGDAPYGKCSPIGGNRMAGLYKPWPSAQSRFGDWIVLSFLCVQMLDGMFTYLGVKAWGPGIEGNPLISSAVAHAGVAGGIAGAKLFASALGVALHLKRVHLLVALLTAFYLVVAIVPWTILFLS
jgi:hypothetical protein